MRRLLANALLASLVLSAALRAAAPTLGPEKGYLVIVGGGTLTAEIKSRFVTLAGGPDASFVVIPTAQGDPGIDLDRIQKSF